MQTFHLAEDIQKILAFVFAGNGADEFLIENLFQHFHNNRDHSKGTEIIC